MGELAENLGFNIQRLQIADVRQCLQACCMCIRSCIKWGPPGPGHRVIFEKTPWYPQVIHKWCDWPTKACRLGKSSMRHTMTSSHDWRHLPSLYGRYSEWCRCEFGALQLNFRWGPTMKSLKWIQWEQAFGKGSAYQASDCWLQQKESRDAPGPERNIWSRVNPVDQKYRTGVSSKELFIWWYCMYTPYTFVDHGNGTLVFHLLPHQDFLDVRCKGHRNIAMETKLCDVKAGEILDPCGLFTTFQCSLFT